MSPHSPITLVDAGAPGSGLEPDNAWQLGAGDVIAPGRRVVRRLAGGGAHEVFLVEMGARLAAAKLLRPHLATDAHCLLLLGAEGGALEQLEHPALPQAFDTVLSGTYPHLLLEYVPGPTLDDVLAAGRPLSPCLVASLGCELARGLAHIAAAGWVHLDVKPSNIVLNAAPRLLDFELARPAADAARMTHPAGTWAYMPPEQRAAGRPDAPAVAAAADVFALAASLHAAFTGRHLSQPSRPPRAASWGGLGALLAAALAPTPSERPTAAP